MLAVLTDIIPDFIQVIGYADDAILVRGSSARWCVTPVPTRFADTGRERRSVSEHSAASHAGRFSSL